MIIEITNNQDKVEISPDIHKYIEQAVEMALIKVVGKSDFEVSVAIVDNDEIASLNEKYRNVVGPTDVLSFPMEDDILDEALDVVDDEIEEVPMLGDIIISAEKAAEQAVDFGHSLMREVCYLTVHSTLHLLGYDHEDDTGKEKMRQIEESVLSDMGLER